MKILKYILTFIAVFAFQNIYSQCDENITLKVRDWNNVYLPNIKLDIVSENQTYSLESNSDGEININLNELGIENGIISLNFQDFYTATLNGVSTLDIVLTQQHILGLGELEANYAKIAADVNEDGRISSLDIVTIRAVILGLFSDFEGGNTHFINEENMKIIDELTIENCTSNFGNTIEIVVLRKGDINGSAINN